MSPRTKKTASPSEEAKPKTEPEPKKDAVVEKINSIRFLFTWNQLQPDARQYKPSNPILTPSEPIIIEVRVPLQPDLVVNAIDISGQQLTNQTESKPHLTPLGMRYVIDQFEAAMSNSEPKDTPEESAKKDDEDWGDDEAEPETKKAAPKSDDEDWGEDTTQDESTEKSDEEFNEDWS